MHKSKIRDMKLDPLKQRIYTIGVDRKIKLYDLQEKEIVGFIKT